MPKVVETWGSPDASRGILAASFAQDRVRPVFFLHVNRHYHVVEYIKFLMQPRMSRYLGAPFLRQYLIIVVKSGRAR